MNGIIHSIESLAAVDGEGLRFGIFMAGCPLRCAYCHNPDTWEMTGKTVSPSELVNKILRYKFYFGENGGVTFSGGEPLWQAEFLKETATLLNNHSISYIIDTSGHVPLSNEVCFLLNNAQEVLLDLKFPNESSYLKYTGRGINKTLDLLQYLEKIGKETVIRTVVIDGINETTEYMDNYIKIVKGLKCVKKYELLPFHTLGFFKYEKLGIENPFADKSQLSQDKLNFLQEYVNKMLYEK